MKIGIRAHDFGKDTIENLAENIQNQGFSTIQLALKKALLDVEILELALTPEYAQNVAKVLANYNIDISVLGCYLNFAHPDLKERDRYLQLFKAHLEVSSDFGCKLVGTETGSINGDYSFHKDNHGSEAFNLLVGSLASLVEKAESVNAIVGVEGVASHIIHTPERMKQLLDAIQSKNLKVIFDPVNFITYENHQKQDDMIKNALDLFGDRIEVIHAKDFIVQNQQIKIVPPGEGLFHYDVLFREMKALNLNRPNVLLEDISLEAMQKSKAYLLEF